MQKDFHYYCIFILANLAGYSKDQAKILAYCSQFVDDSKDHRPIKIGTYRYDTVRTAHQGLRSFKWNVHKKVYFPFHFIPQKPLLDESFSYITIKNGPFVRMLLEDAVNENAELRLFRMGIALHTFADSWSHNGFSGRRNRENDIDQLEVSQGGNWKPVKKWRTLLDLVLDPLGLHVGHMQAYQFPDQSFQAWKHKKHKSERYNPLEFGNAAYEIIKYLAAANNKTDVDLIWAEHSQKIKALFELPPPEQKNELDGRCEIWMDEYPQFFTSNEDPRGYSYSSSEWRSKAMAYARHGELEQFLKTDWVKFQRAALKQRYFVLNQLM